MRRQWQTVLGTLLVPLGLMGCNAALEEITPGICGNGIIENGEDCDGHARDGFACNSTCRVECANKACPSGWGCGSDSICREPSENYEAVGAALPLAAEELTLADFDGDGQKDVLARSGSTFSIAYLDVDGFLAKTSSTTIASADPFGDIPAVGDLDADGLDDLAMRVSDGLGILRGQSDRTLSPIAYSLDVPDDLSVLSTANVVTANGNPGLNHLGSELFVYASGMLASVSFFSTPAMPGGTSQPIEIQPLLSWMSTPAGDALLAAAPFYDTAGDQLLIAFDGTSSVEVYQPSLKDTDPLKQWNYKWNTGQSGSVSQRIYLPDGVEVKGSIFGSDVDGDGDFDIVVNGWDGSSNAIYVAYRLDNGFHSAQKLGTATEADFKASKLQRWLFSGAPGGGTPEGEAHFSDPPLAIGDLNNDCIVDFVTKYGVYLSLRPDINSTQCPPNLTTTTAYVQLLEPSDREAGWKHASLVDMDRDGNLDVITTTSDAGFTFHRGTGSGAFNPFPIPTAATVENLRLGDYDGDGIWDLAFTQTSLRAASQGGKGSSLHVSFGNLAGAPSAPIDLGDIGEVLHMEAPLFVKQSTNFDLMHEIIAISKGTNGISFYLFNGSSDRQLQSPLQLLEPDTSGASAECKIPLSQEAPSPRRLAIGQFDGKDELDVAAFAMGRPNGGTPDSSFWLLPSKAQRGPDLCSSQTINAPMSMGPPSDDARLIPVDVDRSSANTDEVIAFVPENSMLYVLGLDETQTFSQRWSIDIGPGNKGITTLDPAGTSTSEANSKKRDLIIWNDDKIKIVSWKDVADPGKPYQNEISLKDILCPGNEAAIAEGKQMKIQGVAAFDQGLKEGEHLLFVVTEVDVIAAHAVYLPGVGWEISVLDENKKPLCLTDFLGGGGSAVATGDVTGDGIDDVLIARPGGVQIFKRLPRVD